VTKKISTIQGYKVKADRLALESCLEEAQVLYAKVCKIVPNDIEAWVKLGETQRRLGRYKNAELSGRRAVRLAPNEVLVHQLLAVSLHSQRKFSEAITVYRKAIQLKPTYSPSHYLLGVML
jgi:Flp pilus assembly protein TadD